jgi:hypothetical protein
MVARYLLIQMVQNRSMVIEICQKKSENILIVGQQMLHSSKDVL